MGSFACGFEINQSPNRKEIIETNKIDFLDDSSEIRLYMLMGSDYRPEAGYRTDTLILVALDRSSNKASIISFPRDLWVVIPGYGEQRINTVMQLGGFPLLADTLQYNFGVYPTQYAMIDMAGFLQIIDVQGLFTPDSAICTVVADTQQFSHFMNKRSISRQAAADLVKQDFLDSSVLYHNVNIQYLKMETKN